MPRTVFHSQYLDKETGEIIENRKNWISKNNERFIMLRITDGMDWVSMLTGSEIKSLLFLGSIIDKDSQYVHFNNYRRDELRIILEYKTATSVNNTLNSLIKKGVIKKIYPFNDTFMINPRFCYTGSSMNYDLIEQKYINLKT